jgi:DNA-binding CsgD family transcriptional regulator
MRCLLGKKSPGDFCVAVGVNVALSGVLAQRVRKLMQECEDVPLAVQIGSRQKEVLELVLLKLSNKEIAMQVHISQTTVKYHISALLRKFKLKNRLSLIQRSDDLTPAAGWLAEVAPPSLIFASGDLVERLIVADTHPSIFRSGPGGKRAGTR